MRHENVEYLPPPDESIKSFARELCEGMSARYGDESYMHLEVVSGLAHFLKTMLQLEGKYRNAKPRE
jgi:hypothetical protein